MEDENEAQKHGLKTLPLGWSSEMDLIGHLIEQLRMRKGIAYSVELISCQSWKMYRWELTYNVLKATSYKSQK